MGHGRPPIAQTALEDANRLLALALTPKAREIQDRFRRGEL